MNVTIDFALHQGAPSSRSIGTLVFIRLIFKLLSVLLFLSLSSQVTSAEEEEEWITVENMEGQTLKIQPLSLLQTKEEEAYVCFRLPDSRRWYLYPVNQLTPASRVTIVSAGEKGHLLVADNVTGEDLDFLERYLEAEPRERLLLRRAELVRRERELYRRTEQLREQTNRLQMQVAQTTDPAMRQQLLVVFQRTLQDRDQHARQLSLVQAELDRLRRDEERLRKLALAARQS